MKVTYSEINHLWPVQYSEHLYEVMDKNKIIARLTVSDLGDKTWKVDGVWVHTAYRRQGIASEMMREVCTWADANRIGLVLRACPTMNDGTKREWLYSLYSRFGFKPIFRSSALGEICGQMTRQPQPIAVKLVERMPEPAMVVAY